jgi:nucleoside-diphosphate-sugar epimerase
LESGTRSYSPRTSGVYQRNLANPPSQVTASQAIESGNPVLGYNASKKLAEQAAWRFMEENKPVFDLTVINPDIIIGPILQPPPGPDSVNDTNEFAVYNFINGVYKQIDGLTFPFYHFVSAHSLQVTGHENDIEQFAKSLRFRLTSAMWRAHTSPP